eukprot:jgi/Psemu1/47844/gm1.47844_g
MERNNGTEQWDRMTEMEQQKRHKKEEGMKRNDKMEQSNGTEQWSKASVR